MRKSLLSAAPLRVRNDGGTSKSTTRQSMPSTKLGGSSLPRASMSRQSTSRASTASARSSRSSFGSFGAYKKPRHSSGIGIRGRTGVIKDPRPLSDKSYHHRNMKVLGEFLTEQGYTQNITMKVLQSPTSKDFFKMFEFLYNRVDPKFQLTNRKPEEEIPKVMKQLGYPFMISKSAMFAIGSPHTWPNMLAMLIWLIDIIKYAYKESANGESLLFPPGDEGDFDSVPENKIFFEYGEQTYIAYMSGADTYEEHDEELNRILTEKYCGSAGGIDFLMETNKRLVHDLELLEKDSDRLKTLEEQKDVLLSDDRTFSAYLSELDSHVKNLDKQFNEICQECTAVESEKDEIKQRIEQLQKVYDMQELTPCDIERLRLTGQELKRQMDEVEKEIESVEESIWNEEVNFAKSREKCETACHAYNSIAADLKLIPPTALNAQGIEFELRPNVTFISEHHIERIKRGLTEFKGKITENIHSLLTEKMRKQDNIETITDLIGEIQVENTSIENAGKRVEEEIESQKQIYQREHHTIQQEIDCCSQDMRKIQTGSQKTLQDVKDELREIKKWSDEQINDSKRKETAALNFLWKATNLVANAKAALVGTTEQMLNNCKEHQKRMHDKWRKVNLNTN